MPSLRWLWLLLLPMLATAASFDCSKAATATEQAICRQPELSVLDDKWLPPIASTISKACCKTISASGWLARVPNARPMPPACKADTKSGWSNCRAQLIRQHIDNAMPAYRFDITLLNWGERDWAAEGPASSTSSTSAASVAYSSCGWTMCIWRMATMASRWSIPRGCMICRV
jgi:hypothetical protein